MGTYYFDYAHNGSPMPLSATSTVAFTMVMHVTTYKLFIMLNHISGATLWVSIIVLLGYYLILFVMSAPAFSQSVDPEFTHMSLQIFSQPLTYVVINSALIAVVPDFIYNRIHNIFRADQA